MNKYHVTLLLDGATVAGLLSLEDCIEAVRNAFAAHEQGCSLAPGLLHVDTERGEFHIKAGGLSGKHTYVTTKVGAGFFRNQSELGLPNITGLIILSDGITGLPLAVMDSAAITELRTAAATSVAAQFLARGDSKVATICGAGVQGRIHLKALARTLPIERAYLWSRRADPTLAQRLSRELGLEVIATQDLSVACPVSDVIVTCTPAKQWYLGRAHVQPGTFIAAVGADSPEKQELEPELLADSSVFCDILAQCARVGDLHHAIAAGLLSPADVRGELGALICDRVRGRTHDVETIVFDSTGTALQDVAAATVAFERARAAGLGTPFAFYGDPR